MKLQLSGQFQEQYKNDGLRNATQSFMLTQSSGMHLTIDFKSMTVHSVVKSDAQHTEDSDVTHYRSKMGVIYMEL